MDVAELTAKVSPGRIIGLGLSDADPREGELLRRADFCGVEVFRAASDMLDELARGSIDAAVRGSLASGPFLKQLHVRNPRLKPRRAALLAPDARAFGRGAFLLGPVGIDEGGTLEANRRLVADMKSFAAVLGWEPRIAVLSAGRPEDAGRGRRIAQSINRGEAATADGSVRHYHILIEEAVEWANCLIAPDGVTGNLIYRSLVHLGGATSLGALYFPRALKLADTSRNGKLEEYLGAIALANLSAAAAGAD